MAFTLIEVLATMLVLAMGMGAVLSLVRLGVRWSGEAQAQATAMATASSVIVDPRPGLRTPDVGDTDGDGWELVSGNLDCPASGDYAFEVRGLVNGYFVRRRESSTFSDIIHARSRAATVQVDVYLGSEGLRVATLKERIQREWGSP